MSRDRVIAAVIAALKESQRQSGCTVEEPITPDTIPIGELRDFDSLNGVEATLSLEGLLDRKLPVNLFADDELRRSLSVAQVADRILLLSQEAR